MMETQARVTADYWGSQRVWQDEQVTQWLQLDAVQNRIAAKISGDPAINWVKHVINRYYPSHLPVASCLSLGCGEGELERELAGCGFFSMCDAYDIAVGSITRATQAAAHLGIQNIAYHVADANDLALPPAHYDAVFIHSALHHLSNLEGVLAGVRRALKPGGLFIVNEYIGPNRFQFPPAQVAAMNAALALLPLAYRRMEDQSNTSCERGANNDMHQTPALGRRIRRLAAKAREGVLWPTVERKMREATFQRFNSPDGARYKLEVACPTVWDVIALDPSEAVRSADIVPLLYKNFEIVERQGYGGALLHYLLGGIAGNFATTDDTAQALLEMLFCIEDSLLAAHTLHDDFAVIVARAPGAARDLHAT